MRMIIIIKLNLKYYKESITLILKILVMDKVVLTESEQREVDLITEEFKARGGMSTEELISRLDAIPFEEFMNKLEKRIETIKDDNICK